MAIQAGFVGLPNVGKSTLFNALTKSGVPAENFPFCTIDPHTAIAEVPDDRLNKLAAIFESQKTIPTVMQFVDIAGLVKGAADGEGLGNKFLSHIMEVNLVIHVLRCFEDDNIMHVNDSIDPLSDFDTIVAELFLKDLESLEKRQEKILNLKKKNASNQSIVKELQAETLLIDAIKKAVDQTDLSTVYKLVLEAKEQDITTVPLLTGKKYLLVANVAEEEMSDEAYKQNKWYQSLVERFGEAMVIPVSAKIESELAELSDEEIVEFKETLGIKESGLETIVRKTYDALGLITFFTCGPKEAHAWSLKKETKVPAAAGEIHSDLERGFICAEVYNAQDLFELKSEQQVKTAGRLRTEGKEYIVQDGDLLNVRFNV
ncbi:redox-regulated ATPase YchF [Candidatus Dependentiae bacterium]|nr:MAG: redox-regulated ATPase YchF [Candidatus Dependentiae bacterium]